MIAALQILVALLALFVPLATAADAHDTWVFCGQSNAIGRGALPGADPDPKVEIWDGKGWSMAKDPVAGGSVSPWLYAALEACKASPIRLVDGGCYSGTPIDNWDEGKQGLTFLAGLFKKPNMSNGVFLFLQGESDGMNGLDGAAYKQKLQQLAKNVRAYSKNPALLLVIVQIGTWKETKGDFMPIREAQRQFVCEDGNSILVPALGCATQDYVHLSKEGNAEAGRRIGRALLKVRYEQENTDWPGPVMDAAVAGQTDSAAIVHFAEVKKLSGAAAEDFGAIDSGGAVKCSKVEAQNTRIALTFERPLKLPAKIVYGSGQAPKATLRDEAGNPAPAVQLELVRGKFPDDKESRAPNGAGAAGSLDVRK